MFLFNVTGADLNKPYIQNVEKNKTLEEKKTCDENEIIKKGESYHICKKTSHTENGYHITKNNSYHPWNVFKTHSEFTEAGSGFVNKCMNTCESNSDCKGFSLYQHKGKSYCNFVNEINDLPTLPNKNTDYYSYEKLNKEKDIERRIEYTNVQTCTDKSNQDVCFITTDNNVRYTSHVGKEIKLNKNEKVKQSETTQNCSNVCDEDPKCRGFNVLQMDNQKKCYYIIHDFHEFSYDINNPQLKENDFSIAFEKQSLFRE